MQPQVENALLSLDWNGVEEREELEGRRTKLTAQLDEAIALKVILYIWYLVYSVFWVSCIMCVLYFVFELMPQTHYLKVAIDRRSSTVADYVESYLGEEERERFIEVVATKVRLMVEIREIQEKVWRNNTKLLLNNVSMIFPVIRLGWGRPSWLRCHNWRRPILSTTSQNYLQVTFVN